MSLTKKFLKSKPVCKVTFRLKSATAKEAKKVNVLGDFNDWNPKKGKMKKLKSGEFTLTLDLESDRDYEYRYLMDGSEWENDDAADKYVPSGVGVEENCVVSV